MYTLRFPTQIHFGSDALDSLAAAVSGLRPLLVCDPTLLDLPAYKRIEDILGEVPVFSEARGNPELLDVERGTEAFREHACDSIVMLGGGCALDVGKAIALQVSYPGELASYEEGTRLDTVPKIIAIPTTSGTGSEVGGSTVIGNGKAKLILWSPQLIPDLAIVDPSLTCSLPPALSAATGVDALSHHLEAFLAQGYQPMCEAIALEGIRLIFENLPLVYSQPDNLEARSHMSMAAMMGAVAFQKGLGVNHSCAHALSICFDLHHGLANALMLRASMEFNYQVGKFCRLGRAVGSLLSDEEAGQDFLQRLGVFLEQFSFSWPEQVKLTPELIAQAQADPCHLSNPRPVTAQDFDNLFLAAGCPQ